MPGLTQRTAAILTALCATTLGFQHELEVEQSGRDHREELLQESFTKQHNEGCSGDILWTAKQFEMLLTKRRVNLLPEVFTDTGVVITSNQAGPPSEVLGEFISSLKETIVGEEAFCSTGEENETPKIVLRFRTFDRAAAESTVTFVVQLILEKMGDKMLVALAEVFINNFAPPATEDVQPTGRGPVHEKACPQEAIQLAKGYVAALGARNWHALEKMFASDGQVLSTSSGLRNPEDFFKGFLTSLKDARAVDTATFCEMKSAAPMVMVRFDFFYKPHGDKEYHQGVYIDQFTFVRKHKDLPLKLKFVHMFGNGMVEPAPLARKDAFYLHSKDGSSCSYEALQLVRTYLHALRACNQNVTAKIFSPEAMVVTSHGKTKARKFYEEHLSECSVGEVVEEAVFCQVASEKSGPLMSVRFHHGYTYNGEHHSADFFGQLSFGRRDTDYPLQIMYLELFKNSLNEAMPHPWYSSYLLHEDRKLIHNEHEYLKFLVPHHEDTAEGCSQEAFALVEAYFDALGNHDWAALQHIFAPEAKIMSPRAGLRLAVEFYASILPLFKKVSAVKEELFCEMHEAFGTVATRSALVLDDRVGVIFTHFFFVRTSKYAPLQLRTVEIFDNQFITPAKAEHHHLICSEETYSLVRKYLRAMATKSPKSMDELFCKDGKVKSPSIGVKSARDFFPQFLPLLSDVKIEHEKLACEEHADEPPTLTATFDFSYSLAGIQAKSKYHNNFRFVRAGPYLKLKLEVVEMLQVGHGGFKP